ncbi:MAG: DNA double-strand break repair nuclease NurA [Caldilineales bacterium]|nr:DNA double-strand break repair nuclease NurA [Caldilineales bacterium]
MLELRKLLDPLEAMGAEIAQRQKEYSRLAEDAAAQLQRTPVDAALQAKIELALKLDHTWRGAEPVEATLDRRHRPTSPPESATLIAVDGSQIYPDRHGPLLYYLLNTGAIIFRQGSAAAPQVETQPSLHFSDAELYDVRGNLIKAERINARRELAEMQRLAALAVEERTRGGGDLDPLILAIKDGQLMMWLGERDLFEAEGGEDAGITADLSRYIDCLHTLQRVQATPIGFVSTPRSANVIRLLWISALDAAQITREEVQQSPYRGLSDAALFARLLGPNQRSALFATTARVNRERFAPAGQRICFFYLNVAQRQGPDWAQIARIDLPEWVARQPQWADRVQNALYHDCVGMRFPYVLARADELAVVSQQEKRDLEQMLAVQLARRTGALPEPSPKARQKDLSRGYSR